MLRLSRVGFTSLGLLSLVVLHGCTCAAPGSCVSQDDCTNTATPQCDTQKGVCVACVLDTHCADGFVCLNGACAPGCAPDDPRCGPNQVCAPGVGCVECVVDAQCGPGRVCTNNVCVVGCSPMNPDCPSGLVCNEERGLCVECLTNAQCPNPPLTVCHPQTNTCVQCASNTDCTEPARPVCQPTTNTCVGCLTNGDCPTGVCHMNRCVQCTSDAQCGGTTPRCNQATNTCVACLPGASDNCPTGQRCRPDFTCEQGCKTGADCPSGVCLPDGSCQGCTADTQCAAGKVCQNGTCVGACGPNAPCGSNQTCCNGRCENTQASANHCGACGISCGAGQACCGGQCKPLNTRTDCGSCGNTCAVDQFCDGSGCKTQTFPNFCANQNVVAIRDGVPNDNVATGILASTIQQYCSPSTNIVFGDDDDPALVDQATGAILLGGGWTVVTAGGPFPNLPVRWLERTQRVTKVYFSNNTAGTEFYFRQRLPADAGTPDPIIVTRAQSTCTQPTADGGVNGARNDVFLVELAIDPFSGTLALISYGLCSPGNGTLAGAWYWANHILPNRASFPDSWYIFEWTDANGNGQPDAQDTWTQLASGR
jgi:Cys-rich repeat protein